MFLRFLSLWSHENNVFHIITSWAIGFVFQAYHFSHLTSCIFHCASLICICCQFWLLLGLIHFIRFLNKITLSDFLTKFLLIISVLLCLIGTSKLMLELFLLTSFCWSIGLLLFSLSLVLHSFCLYDSNLDPFFLTISKLRFWLLIHLLFLVISPTDLWINPSLDKYASNEQAAYLCTPTFMVNRWSFYTYTNLCQSFLTGYFFMPFFHILLCWSC